MDESDSIETFHRLIKAGDLIELRSYFENGVDVNMCNRFGWTPLMLAAVEGHTAIIQYLLASGANVGATNDFGASALAYAALEGNCRAIEVLLNAGAPLNVQPHGVSLLEFAARGGGRFKMDKHFVMLRAAGAN